MCGRYTLTTPLEGLRQLFELVERPNLQPRYNIAPTQEVPLLRLDESGRRRLSMARWGLIPAWAKDRTVASRLINARSDGVADKPSFRSAFAKRRCLIPADGFYEWKTLEGRKQPFHITLAEGGPFAFAGLWESWNDPQTREVVETCCIITTDAAPNLAAIHHRMPVILPPAAYGTWLDPASGRGDLLDLLKPYDAAPMAFRAVSVRVNKVANDDPDLLTESPGDEPAEPQPVRRETPAQGSLF